MSSFQIHTREGHAIPASNRFVRVGLLAVFLIVGTVACDTGAATTRTITLQGTDSGVTGTVEFIATGRNTAVKISVDPAGNLDMPAHIHPGTCEKTTPQPRFPLESVKDGTSSTVVPATIDELFTGGLALNTHRSNDDMKTSTACVDLK